MRSRCLQTRRRLVNVLAVCGWILHICQFIDRLFDVCSGNVLVRGIVSNVLHLAASQYLRRLILGLRLAFGVTASLCLR